MGTKRRTGGDWLTARAATTAKKAGLLADGRGLYLQVSLGPAGNPRRSWIFRYSHNGQTRDMGLGSAADFGLSEARQERDKWRKILKRGADPIEARKSEQVTPPTTMTFDECGRAYVEAHGTGWKDRAKWEAMMARHVSPVIGAMPVSAIATPDVMRALGPIWISRTKTAAKLRSRIERVLDWARVAGHREGENPARWRGHLDKLLARPSKIAKTVHHPALPYSEVGTFMAALRQREGVSALALQLAILTAARASEVLGATFDEVDIQNGLWTVPAARMKGGREHRVPLSPAAVEVIRTAQSMARGSNLVFPNPVTGGRLSKQALRAALLRMGRDDVTVHGFRSTFRDWCGESTSFPRDLAEAALAHSIGDETERAYARGDLLAKRRRLMDAWAAFCTRPAAADSTVTPMRGRAHA